MTTSKPKTANPPPPATEARGSGQFSPEVLADLRTPLDGSVVAARKQGGRNVSYVEGWWVMAEANRIFGFDGWSRETVRLECVASSERMIGKTNPVKGWSVTYIAKVKVEICTNSALRHYLVREGCGAGHGIDRDLGQAHESALKEAETDALKRALVSFGWPFGLALYDKKRVFVSGNAPAGAPDPEYSEPEPPKAITPAQAEQISDLILESGRDPGKILAWAGAATIEEIRSDLFDEIVQVLKRPKAEPKQEGEANGAS